MTHGLNSPQSAAAGGGEQEGEEGLTGRGEEMGMDGSATPHSQDGVPPVNQNDELYLV